MDKILNISFMVVLALFLWQATIVAAEVLSSPSVARVSPQPAAPPVESSIVGITAESKCIGREGSTGTGWVVGKNLVATGAHVIIAGQAITVGYGANGDISPKSAQVVGYNPRTDLALLHTDTGDIPPLKLMPFGKELDVNKTYKSIGHPRGRALEESPLALTSYDNHSVRGKYYKFNGSVEPGDSGSPVFDQNDIVSGIVFGTSHDYRTAYITPVGYLHTLIGQSKANGWQEVHNGGCNDNINL